MEERKQARLSRERNWAIMHLQKDFNPLKVNGSSELFQTEALRPHLYNPISTSHYTLDAPWNGASPRNGGLLFDIL